MNARRGEVWLIRLDPGAEGHEQQKTRPCVVVQADVLNQPSHTAVIAAISAHSDRKGAYPFCVTLEPGEGGLLKQSVVNGLHLRAVDERRLIRRLGVLSPDTLVRINRALRIVLDLDRTPAE